jgi:membrane protein
MPRGFDSVRVRVTDRLGNDQVSEPYPLAGGSGKIESVPDDVRVEAARRYIPFFVESNERILNLARYGITVGALTIALFILHAWLPCGRRSFLQILPGIIFTIVASLISGVVFGQYLARFANNYVTMYAGLASVIIALVFLYFLAAIFVFGGELNAAIIKSRLPHGVSLQAAQSLAHAD